MNGQFKLSIYNDVTLKGSTCFLQGTVGQDIVTLKLEGGHSGVSIELSASELIIASSRLASQQDDRVVIQEIKPPQPSTTTGEMKG